MQKHEYASIGETMVETKLENGLSIFVFPKPEFEKYYAFFATNYGGMDTKFQVDGEWRDTPKGVAHFLEHKMFDTKDGNALQALSAQGASPNAFTSSSITGYYFECTEGFSENLRILLSFVSEPYFTQESVNKEQGIIGQEIRMIEDTPNWQAFTGLMAALYENHPIRNSVAGTRESIAEITADTLYACHEAFYNPGNMVLCVAGNVDPQEVTRIAREILPQSGKGEIPRDYGRPEEEKAFQSEKEIVMAVSTPIFELGFKVPPAERGEKRLRQRLLGELAAEALMGASTPLYARLYQEGLVDHGFSYGYMDDTGCAMVLAGGESRDPAAVRAAVLEEADRLTREGLDEGLFQRLKKAAYGGRVRSLNSFETLCVDQAQAYFAGEDVWTFPQVFETIEKSDVERTIAGWFQAEKAALMVVRPGEGGQ